MSLGDDSMTRMPWTGSPRLHHSWLRWQGRRLHRQPELQHQRRIPGIVLHYDAIEVYATAPPWATRLSGKPPTISEVEPTRVITRRRLLASLALTPFDGHSAMRLVGLPRFGCSVAFSNTTGLSAVRHVQPFQVVAGPAPRSRQDAATARSAASARTPAAEGCSPTSPAWDAEPITKEYPYRGTLLFRPCCPPCSPSPDRDTPYLDLGGPFRWWSSPAHSQPICCSPPLVAKWAHPRGTSIPVQRRL